MALLDFLFDDTLRYIEYLLGSGRDSRSVRSTLESFEHSVVPAVSAALEQVGLMRIAGLEVLVTAVKVLAAAVLACLVLRALPRRASWGAAVVLCVAMLHVQPGDFTRAATPPTPPGPSPPPKRFIICTPPLVNDTGRCDCPGNLVQYGPNQCIPRMHDGTVQWLLVRAGRVVDWMRLCTRASRCVQAGGTGGSERMWLLRPNQCIVKVEWWAHGEPRDGDYILGVRFTANDGTSLFHGNTDAAYHDEHAPKGQCLVGAELGDDPSPSVKYWGKPRAVNYFRPQWG
jgi:hypothetical protein